MRAINIVPGLDLVTGCGLLSPGLESGYREPFRSQLNSPVRNEGLAGWRGEVGPNSTKTRGDVGWAAGGASSRPGLFLLCPQQAGITGPDSHQVSSLHTFLNQGMEVRAEGPGPSVGMGAESPPEGQVLWQHLQQLRRGICQPHKQGKASFCVQPRW